MVLSGRMQLVYFAEGDPPNTRGMIALEDTEVLEVSSTELEDVVRLEDRYGRTQ